MVVIIQYLWEDGEMDNQFNQLGLRKFQEEPVLTNEKLESFCSLLVSSRKTLKKGRPEVALEISVTVAALVGWEKGIYFPPEEKYPAIMKAYNISEEEFFKRLRISQEANELKKESFRLTRSKKNNQPVSREASQYSTITNSKNLKYR